MEFEYKQVKMPSRAAKRMPKGAVDLRAYKVKLKAGPGYDEAVIGTIITGRVDDQQAWATYSDSVLKSGFESRHQAAVSMV